MVHPCKGTGLSRSRSRRPRRSAPSGGRPQFRLLTLGSALAVCLPDWAVAASVGASAFPPAYYAPYYSNPSSAVGARAASPSSSSSSSSPSSSVFSSSTFGSSHAAFIPLANPDRQLPGGPESVSAAGPRTYPRHRLTRREAPAVLATASFTQDSDEAVEQTKLVRPDSLLEVSKAPVGLSFFEDTVTLLSLIFSAPLTFLIWYFLRETGGLSRRKQPPQHQAEQQQQQQQHHQQQQQQQQQQQHQQHQQQQQLQPTRINVVDTAKFWMMLAVMIVHWDCCFSAGLPASTYPLRFLNPWCTRTFALLSGVVSKEPVTRENVSNLLVRIVAPYILFNTVLSFLVFTPINIHGFPTVASVAPAAWYSIAYAENASWYLIGLAQWRLLSTPFANLNGPRQLFISIMISSIGGYAGISYLRFDWAIATYPFFVFGQLFNLAEALRKIPDNTSTKALGVGLLAALCIFQAAPLSQNLMGEIPTFGWSSTEHYQLNGSWKEESAYQWFWLRGYLRNIFELCKSLIFLLLCLPRTSNMLSYFGQYTLYPFLLHWEALTLATKVFAHVPWTNDHTRYPVVQGIFQWIFAVIGLILLLMFLSVEPVRFLFRPFVEPLWLRQILRCRSSKK